jgi:hypothetical protein
MLTWPNRGKEEMVTGSWEDSDVAPDAQSGDVSGRLPGLAGSRAMRAVICGGARTPEELETLLEDALVMRDREALAKLFEAGAVLREGDGPLTRGAQDIAHLSLTTWEGDRAYVADPRHVIQARDIALIVAEQGVNVARRDHDGDWRYVIVRRSVEDGHDRRKQ